jgi:hypothetical protein
MRSAANFETLSSGASRRSVKFVRQYAVTKQQPVFRRQAPRSAPAHRVCSVAPRSGHQLAANSADSAR